MIDEFIIQHDEISENIKISFYIVKASLYSGGDINIDRVSQKTEFLYIVGANSSNIIFSFSFF